MALFALWFCPVSCWGDTEVLVRPKTAMLADYAATELLIFNEAIYYKHFSRYTFDVPILIYRHERQDMVVEPHSKAIHRVEDPRNRVYRVARAIDQGTLWARDVTPFTISNDKGQKGLVTFYPWMSDSSSYLYWLKENRTFGADQNEQERRFREKKWNGKEAQVAPRIFSDIIFENQQALFGKKVYEFVRHLPLNIEGGNLVTTGTGLCFVSQDVLSSNYLYRRSEIKRLLRTRLGCHEIRFVEEPQSRRKDIDSSHADWALSAVSPLRLLVSELATDDLGAVPGIADLAVLTNRSRFGVQMLQVNGDIFLPDLGAETNQALMTQLLKPAPSCPLWIADAPTPRRFFFENVAEEQDDKGAGIHCMSGQLH